MRLFVIAVFALLAACQPLPHPFDDARTLPPPNALKPPDSAGIVVIAPAGEKDGAVMAAALVKALLAEDVPASTEGGNRGSFRLELADETASAAGGQRLALRWTLRDAKGAVRGRGTATREFAAAALPGDATAAVAGAAAAKIAALVAGDAPVPLSPDVPVEVSLGAVTGAPGDGGTALARAIDEALGRAGVELGAPGAPSRFALSCEVAVAPAEPGKELVSVRWILASGGRPLGQVSQQNTVPAGSLDHDWGDVAEAVAVAAAPGIAELISRAETAGS